MKKLKIAQIGTGHDHASQKMDCVRNLPDYFEVVAIAEPNPALLETNRQNPSYAGLPWVPQEDILASNQIDAVLVETGEQNLVPAGLRCIEAGKPIHLDKPAGFNFPETVKLMKLAKEKKLAVHLGYMYRYNPAVQKAMTLIQSGRLGTVYQVDAIMDTEHSAEKRRWLNGLPCGNMFFLGCHMVDLVYRIMGEPEEIIPFHLSTGFENVNSIDHGFAVFRYPHGISTIRATSTEVNGYGRRQLVICGTKGTVEIKPLETNDPAHWCRLSLSISDQTAGNFYRDIRTVFPDEKVTGRYHEMMLDFYRFVAEGKENPYTYDYETAMHRVFLKACNIEANEKEDPQYE